MRSAGDMPLLLILLLPFWRLKTQPNCFQFSAANSCSFQDVPGLPECGALPYLCIFAFIFQEATLLFLFQPPNPPPLANGTNFFLLCRAPVGCGTQTRKKWHGKKPHNHPALDTFLSFKGKKECFEIGDAKWRAVGKSPVPG